MSVPCEQAEVIKTLSSSQVEQSRKIDIILETLNIQTKTFNESIKELTQVLLQNARHGEVLLQLKKENDIIFISQREIKHELYTIKERNARCDGAGIFENFPKIWDWHTKLQNIDLKKMSDEWQQDKGIRRFIPAALTAIAVMVSLWVAFNGPIHQGIQ